MMLSELFYRVLHMSFTASVVIVAVCIARLFLKRAPKFYSYLLWALVLFRLLCPVSLVTSFSVIPDSVSSGAILAEWEDNYIGQTHTIFDNRSEFDTAVEAGRETFPAEEGHYYVVTGGDGISEPNTVENTLLPLLSKIWFVGMLVLIVHSILSYARVRKQTKVAVLFRKGVYLADDVASPFVMGLLRPVIYLPGSLDPAERKYIIAHERHHIHRGDHIFKSLGFLALTIHWFNPLVWVAFVLSNRDMEMSCDEAVIRKLGEDVRADYSASLLNLATGHRLFTGTPLAFGEGDPTGRVRNLAKWKKPKRWIILICVALCIVLAVCLLTDPETYKPLELPTEAANTIEIVLENDPLPDGYFESRDDEGNLIFTDGVNIVGGVVCYSIPEGIYDPDDHIEALLYRLGIPDYLDTSLYCQGGMTSGDNGWLAEFGSDVAEGEERTVHRRHHFYHVEDVVYDIWFDLILLDYETTEEIRVCINLPEENPAKLRDWGVSVVPERVTRIGATATFVILDSSKELTYGDFLSLDRRIDGEWVPVEELPGYEYYVGDSSYPVTDGYGMVHEWPNRFGELPDGTYRMGKLVTLHHADGTTEEQMIYGQFSLPNSIRTEPIPLEELPEKYSGEQAMIDGCFVAEDGAARENKDLFHKFVQDSWQGTPGFIRIVDWHYGDNSYYIAYDLEYDGSMYTLTWYQDGQLRTREFPYIRYFFGDNEDLSYEHYVLIHDEMIDRNIWGDMVASHESIYVDHITVFSNYTAIPKMPQIPADLDKAVLEFEGKELVSTTEFDRLEKLYLLFTEAELLGYEPKTHSVGVGLNLILTSRNGDTVTIELDPDSDICRIDGEYIFYGAYDEPDYIEKLWNYLGIEAWPDVVYENCTNAYRP